MGWFAKIKTIEEEEELSPDLNNPYSMNIEDEGKFVTIIHTRNIETLDLTEEEEKEENGSTRNTSDTPKR